MMSPPDRHAALTQYRRRAPLYDLELLAFEPVRRRAVEALQLSLGDTVLDIGCGTGLSLPLLAAAVGPKGRVVGIEQCPEMIGRARERVVAGGWKNVSLLEAPAEGATLKGRADAALFVFVHDVLLREDAVRNIVGHLGRGARIAATGLQWAPIWALPVNLFVLGSALHSVTSLTALDRPWQGLVPHLAGLEVEPLMAGAVYLATGTIR